jgi:hypothetical protein
MNTEFKGTQTKWKIENPLESIVSIRFSDDKDCDLYLHQYENYEELLANAQIMVTSRELLNSLIAVTNELHNAIECINGLESAKISPTIKQADKAIKNALGL